MTTMHNRQRDLDAAGRRALELVDDARAARRAPAPQTCQVAEDDDDPMRAARGFGLGMVLGLALWALVPAVWLIVAVVVLVWH